MNLFKYNNLKSSHNQTNEKKTRHSLFYTNKLLHMTLSKELLCRRFLLTPGRNKQKAETIKRRSRRDCGGLAAEGCDVLLVHDVAEEEHRLDHDEDGEMHSGQAGGHRGNVRALHCLLRRVLQADEKWGQPPPSQVALAPSDAAAA